MRVPHRRSEADARVTLDPHLTPAAYEKLKAKLERLKKVTRFRLMTEVATLAEGGDFSENAGYQIAKGKLRGVNQAILDLEHRLKTAVIIRSPQQTTTVQIGCMVTIEIDGQKKTYRLLGSTEADPTKNIISITSPLGSALLNRRVGEIVSFSSQTKKRATIISIQY